MTFQKQQLNNGLQIIGEHSPTARSTALGFFVRTGSRDETPEVCGVSHFLEHMVFKGTPRRTYFDVNRDFDRIGASYNAFTSEENTVFYAAVLPEYLPQAVDLLTDILRPSLRGEDFEMEKGVIIEEIGMYDDQPMWSAYDQAKQMYFADHPLGNSILGTEKSIRALQRDQMQRYFDSRYVPSNITAVASGNFEWENLVSLIDEHTGKWEKGEVSRDGIRPAPGSGKFTVVGKDSVAQEHFVLMSPGPPADSNQTYAAGILAMIFGDDSGSRLYWSLIDPGLAESADMSFHEYEGTGAYYTLFSCEKERAKEDLALVGALLQTLQSDGVSEQELRQAKNKVMARLVRSSERPMGRMLAIGASWTYLREYRSLDDELDRFEAVTTADIRRLLDEYPVDNVTTMALGPLADLPRP